MPITLPPIARRQFIRGAMVLGGGALATPRVLATADGEGDALDKNRVAFSQIPTSVPTQIVSTLGQSGQVHQSRTVNMNTCILQNASKRLSKA